MAKPDIPETEILTKDNIHRLEELAWIGDGNISTLRYTNDGRYLVLGGSLGIWVHNELLKTRHLICKNQFEDYSQGFRLSNDNQYIVTSKTAYIDATDRVHTLFIWQLADGICYRTITLYSEFTNIADVRFHPTKPLLIVAINQSDGYTIHKGRIDFININTGEIDFVYIYDGDIEKFDFHPHKNILAIIQKDGQVILCNLDDHTQTPLFSIGNSTERLKTLDYAIVAFHANGYLLYGSDTMLIVWDMTTQTEKIRITTSAKINFACWNWDGTQIALCQNLPYPQISIFDITTKTEIHTISASLKLSRPHPPLVFHPNNTQLLFVNDGQYRTVTRYDLSTGQKEKMPHYGIGLFSDDADHDILKQMRSHWQKHPQADSAKVHPQTGMLISAWNMYSPLHTHETIRGFEIMYDKRIKHLKVVPKILVQDGVVIASPNDATDNWDILRPRGLWKIDLSSDGRWAAVGGGIGHGMFSCGLAFVWDMLEERIRFYFTSAHHFGGEITHVMMTPDDQMAFFVDTEMVLSVWDIANATLCYQTCIYGTKIFMSEDRKLLIANDNNNTLRIWGVRKV